MYLKHILTGVTIESVVENDNDNEDDNNDSWRKKNIDIDNFETYPKNLQKASPHHMTKPFRCLFLALN